MGTPRVAVIAIDAGDSNLVRRWAGEGHLPALARLLEAGLVSTIVTPAAVLEGGIWPTLLTSSMPATHGMFSFTIMRPGSYELEMGMRADRLPAPPFWAYLSRAGKRVAVVDVPFARPLDGLNGMQITNWGVHDSWSWPRSSWPRHAVKGIVKRFGTHPVAHCDSENRSPAEYENLRTGLIAGVTRKTAVLRHVLGLEDWDFFFGVFSEAHCAGHQFWHFMDPEHPGHVPSASPTLRSALLDVYHSIDAGLGSLLRDMPPDVVVLVILSHGMGPYYSGSHLLGAVLDRLGLGAPAQARGFPGRDSYAIGGIRSVAWNLRHLLPTGLRRAMKARLSGPLDALWNLTHPVPSLWKPGTRAFVIPSNNMTSAIRINLRGREPFGAVAPGSEYEKLCEDLTASLLELENPETGQPVVQWVRRARDLYQGPRLDTLPDLFVEWTHTAPINALRSPRIGTVTGAQASPRTGDHVQHGLLLGRGSLLRHGMVGDMRTQDVAPTLLDLLGVPVPGGYEGRSVLPMLLGVQPE